MKWFLRGLFVLLLMLAALWFIAAVLNPCPVPFYSSPIGCP